MRPLLAGMQATLADASFQTTLKAAKGMAVPRTIAAGRTMSCRVRFRYAIQCR